MQRYVALLGGINVGGHRVKMTDLRGHFEALGFGNVATYIASGNVVFDSASTDAARLQARIERHVSDLLGYRVPTFLRTLEEIAAVAAYEPFTPAELARGVHTVSVLFLADALSPETGRTLLTFRTPVDELHIAGREVYWLCRNKTTESLVDWKQVGKSVTLPKATMRNAQTVRGLAARYGEGR